MSFRFEPLEIPDVVLVRSTRNGDERGSLTELYRERAFREGGIDARFVQANATRSTRGVLRGLHYQLPPAAQGKLVGVTRGRMFDVAVDLRAASATFGRWVGRELDADAGELLWIPAGFAHGYQVLTDEADISYQLTAEYDASLARGVRWDDADLNIAWPIVPPVLSDADRAQPWLAEVGRLFGGRTP
jgi:dTDP-4-dehydrorhamnose 3,5-epimerase